MTTAVNQQSYCVYSTNAENGHFLETSHQSPCTVIERSYSLDYSNSCCCMAACRCSDSTASGMTGSGCLGNDNPSAFTTSWKMTPLRFWRSLKATLDGMPSQSSSEGRPCQRSALPAGECGDGLSSACKALKLSYLQGLPVLNKVCSEPGCSLYTLFVTSESCLGDIHPDNGQKNGRPKNCWSHGNF